MSNAIEVVAETTDLLEVDEDAALQEMVLLTDMLAANHRMSGAGW